MQRDLSATRSLRVRRETSYRLPSGAVLTREFEERRKDPRWLKYISEFRLADVSAVNRTVDHPRLRFAFSVGVGKFPFFERGINPANG